MLPSTTCCAAFLPCVARVAFQAAHCGCTVTCIIQNSALESMRSCSRVCMYLAAPVGVCCRCTELQGMDDSHLKVCLKAARYKLLAPCLVLMARLLGSAATLGQGRGTQG